MGHCHQNLLLLFTWESSCASATSVRRVTWRSVTAAALIPAVATPHLIWACWIKMKVETGINLYKSTNILSIFIFLLIHEHSVSVTQAHPKGGGGGMQWVWLWLYPPPPCFAYHLKRTTHLLGSEDLFTPPPPPELRACETNTNRILIY